MQEQGQQQQQQELQKEQQLGLGLMGRSSEPVGQSSLLEELLLLLEEQHWVQQQGVQQPGLEQTQAQGQQAQQPSSMSGCWSRQAALRVALPLLLLLWLPQLLPSAVAYPSSSPCPCPYRVPHRELGSQPWKTGTTEQLIEAGTNRAASPSAHGPSASSRSEAPRSRAPVSRRGNATNPVASKRDWTSLPRRIRWTRSRRRCHRRRRQTKLLRTRKKKEGVLLQDLLW